MNQLLSSLHPNPGWAGSSTHESSDTPSAAVSPTNMSDTIGKHCILELYACNQDRLNDEAFLRDAITDAAKRAGATLLHLVTHHFEPQGVTGLALLAESHISIHTWPESGYAAVDVFTCGDHTMPERACEALIEALDAGDHKLTSFRRETPTAIAGTEREPAMAV